MVSPTLMNTSGCPRRIVSYNRRPPQSGLMPHPWPTVSADQAMVTSRGVEAGVLKLPATGSLQIFRSLRSWKTTL